MNPVGGELTPQQEHVWKALMHAAERIGSANRVAYMKQIKRDRRGKVVQGYRITEAHELVIRAAEDVARGRITPEEGMAVLHEYDVMQQRTQKNPVSVKFEDWTLKIYKRVGPARPPQLIKVKPMQTENGIPSLMPQIRHYLRDKGWTAEKYYFYRKDREIWVLLYPKKAA